MSNFRGYLIICVLGMVLTTFFCVGTAIGQDQSAVERELGCSALTGILEEGPAVLRGFFPGILGNGDVDTIFWCQKTAKDFILVFTKNGELPKAKCPPYLNALHHPFGLWTTKEHFPLSDFSYLEDLRERVLDENTGAPAYTTDIRQAPENKGTEGLTVQDGTSVIVSFYCYEGHWLVMQRD